MADPFNKFVLRRLFNEKNRGKGEKGVSRRTYIHTSLTPTTYQGLAQVITLGPGGYAAPVLDLALRLMLYLIGTMGLDTLADYLLLAVTDRRALVTRLRELADYVEGKIGE